MTMQTQEPPSRLGLPLIVFTILLVAVVNVAELGGWNAAVLQGRLSDADSYLRLVRVLDLRLGSPWFEDLTTRLAPPEGLVIQWTRPLDILLLLSGLAVERVSGLSPRDALFLAGVLISPVLHVAAALAAAWGAQAIWPGRAPWYAALLMIGSPAAATYSALGRPDHHSLIILLLALGIGAVLRAVLPGGSARWAAAAGIAFGTGIWVGPEALIVAGPAMVAIGLIAVIAEHGGMVAIQGRRLCLAMAGTFVLAILLEHTPAEWPVAEYDRISIQQLCFSLLAAGVFALAARVGAVPRRRRLIIVSAVATLAFALLVLLFPGVLQGPLANADAAYLRLFHSSIQENRALPPFGPGSPFDIASYVGGAVFAGLLATGLAMPNWRRDGTWPAGFVLIVTMLAALAGTLGARRFGMDLAPSAAIAGAGMVGLLLRGAWPRSVALRAMVALLSLLGVLGLPFLGLSSATSTAAPGSACDWTAINRWLDSERPLVGSRGSAPTLMASDIFEGPQIVWRTPYRVVATPHHRAGRAIEDNVAVFAATDPEAARAILRRRHVDLVVACTAAPVAEAQAASLAALIRGGRQPDWLIPIAVPATLDNVRVFEVER